MRYTASVSLTDYPNHPGLQLNVDVGLGEAGMTKLTDQAFLNAISMPKPSLQTPSQMQRPQELLGDWGEIPFSLTLAKLKH